MIAYTDGDDAIELFNQVQAKGKGILEKYVSEVIKKNITITQIETAFWKEGSHYYKPSDYIDFEHIRNPEEGIYVIGEAVARRQGWTGGAFETIEEIL